MTQHRLLPIALALSLLVGCPAPGTPPRTGGGPKSPATARPGPAAAPSSRLPGPAGAPADPLAGLSSPAAPPTGPSLLTPPPLPLVVRTDGATLVGKVKAPAALIGNNGGGVVSNNGGGVVSNNGGGLISDKGGGLIADKGAGYRLAAVAQVPFAGASVRVLDAKGQPVLDPAGEPLAAVAGADGTYAFQAPLPANNLLLEVTLPGDKGTLRALAPVGAEARKAADVELVSTLTTGYVLETYVRPQALDPQVTLDRLPAAVELETRRKAEDALAAGQAAGAVALPTVLTDATAAATIAALRGRDQALDAQLEIVKKLLVVAGRADKGTGQLALEAEFVYGPTRGALDRDGALLVANEHHLWRVAADGRLTLLAGGPPTQYANVLERIEGMPATEAPLQHLAAVLVAPDGGIILVEGDGERAARLGADGQLHVVGELSAPGRWFLDGAGVLHALCLPEVRRSGFGSQATATFKTPAELWRFDVPKPAAPLKAFDQATSLQLEGAGQVALAPGGALRVAVTSYRGGRFEQAGTAVYALDLAALTWTTVQASVAGQRLALASDGSLWRVPGQGQAGLQPMAAGAPALAGPEGLEPEGGMVAVGGGAYLVAAGPMLYRLEPAKATRLAGREALKGAGAALELTLVDPYELTIAPDGALYVYDDPTWNLWRIVPGGEGQVVANFYGEDEIGRPSYPTPRRLGIGADGAPWFLDDRGGLEQTLVRLMPAGGLEPVFKAPAPGSEPTPDPELDPAYFAPSWQLRDYCFTPGGGYAVLLSDAFLPEPRVRIDAFGADGKLVKRREAVAPEALLTSRTDGLNLLPAPAGGFYLASATALARWDAEPAPLIHPASAAFAAVGYGDFGARLRIDPKGRLYGMAGQLRDGRSCVLFDPATKQTRAVVGPLAVPPVPGFDPIGNDVDPLVDAAGDVYFVNTRKQVVRLPGVAP